MKSRKFAEKEKTIVHRLTHKAYFFATANKFEENWGPQIITESDSLPREKNWKRTTKNVGNQAVEPVENST